jgi:hypothetical protein
MNRFFVTYLGLIFAFERFGGTIAIVFDESGITEIRIAILGLLPSFMPEFLETESRQNSN